MKKKFAIYDSFGFQGYQFAENDQEARELALDEWEGEGFPKFPRGEIRIEEIDPKDCLTY